MQKRSNLYIVQITIVALHASTAKASIDKPECTFSSANETIGIIQHYRDFSRISTYLKMRRIDFSVYSQEKLKSNYDITGDPGYNKHTRQEIWIVFRRKQPMDLITKGEILRLMFDRNNLYAGFRCHAFYTGP